MARGGHRIGAGRKPPGASIRSHPGGRGVRSANPAETAPIVPQAPVGCPDGLTNEQKMVWAELAPFATEAGTLTPRTLSAFVMLCRNVVLERELAASPAFAGGPNHRGLLQWVASRLKD